MSNRPCHCVSLSMRANWRSRIQKKITGVTTRTCSSDDTMPPSTGVASGFMTSAPALVLHMIGSSPATTVETVITFGRSRSNAPSMTASFKRLPRETAVQRLAPPLHRLFQVDDHHHTRLHGRAEQRDETHPHRDREVVAKRPYQVQTARESEGHREQHVCGFDRGAVGPIEQREDHDQDDRHDDLQSLASARLVLPPSAPCHVITSRQGDVACDCRLGFLDEPADVPALHVQQHCREQQPVLGRQHRRTSGVLDPRQLTERDLRPVRRRHEDVADRLRHRCGYSGAYRTRTGNR